MAKTTKEEKIAELEKAKEQIQEVENELETPEVELEIVQPTSTAPAIDQLNSNSFVTTFIAVGVNRTTDQESVNFQHVAGGAVTGDFNLVITDPSLYGFFGKDKVYTITIK